MDNKAFNALLDSIQNWTMPAVYRPNKSWTSYAGDEPRPAVFFKRFRLYQTGGTDHPTGTGFFITDNGYVATNCHLIERENAFIRRQFILSPFSI